MLKHVSQGWEGIWDISPYNHTTFLKTDCNVFFLQLGATKSLCKGLRKVYRLENLSKKDEGASGKLVKTVASACPSLTKTKHFKT